MRGLDNFKKSIDCPSREKQKNVSVSNAAQMVISRKAKENNYHRSLASFILQSILTSTRLYRAPTAAACASKAGMLIRSTKRL